MRHLSLLVGSPGGGVGGGGGRVKGEFGGEGARGRGGEENGIGRAPPPVYLPGESSKTG